MSRTDVETVQLAMDAYNDGDMMAVVERFGHPDLEWLPILGTAGVAKTVYRGREGFLRHRAEVEEALGDVKNTPLEMRDAGAGRVVVHTLMTGRGCTSNLEVQQELWQVYTLDDGQILRMESFEREDEALDAAAARP